MAATVSDYLDGRLAGEELEKFETHLKSNDALARELQGMRNIESQLVKMGADILTEPVPEALLEAFQRVERG